MCAFPRWPYQVRVPNIASTSSVSATNTQQREVKASIKPYSNITTTWSTTPNHIASPSDHPVPPWVLLYEFSYADSSLLGEYIDRRCRIRTSWTSCSLIYARRDACWYLRQCSMLKTDKHYYLTGDYSWFYKSFHSLAQDKGIFLWDRGHRHQSRCLHGRNMGQIGRSQQINRVCWGFGEILSDGSRVYMMGWHTSDLVYTLYGCSCILFAMRIDKGGI